MQASCIAGAFLVLLACSSTSAQVGSDAGGSDGSGTGSSGGGDSGSVTPDAFVSALVGPGPGTPASACNLGATQELLTIGVATGGKPTTASDGATQKGALLHVTCTVSPAGSGFDVHLQATLDGPNGGSLTITSPSGQGSVTANGGTGVTGAFQSASKGAYHQSGCTITYTYGGSNVPDSPTIAAGRIWGHISCPAAVSDAAQNDQCDAEADFLFEQCGE